ncbi:MAG: nucleotidyltransferase domain-containing protein [Candidatus Pacebacteria bacterium]|nr:nucleotidyltransferase domain-containing protein [Candidatus Paceibacterota bacterium]
MTISEEQIRIWAQPLSTTEYDKSVKTHQSIRKILENHFGSKVEIFLQGSYANSTNVRQDSDIDIVISYHPGYFPDLGFLSEEDKETYRKNRVSHDYSFSQFKNDVENLLNNEFP